MLRSWDWGALGPGDLLLGWAGPGWDGTGWNMLGWALMGWDRIGWDGMESDRMGWLPPELRQGLLTPSQAAHLVHVHIHSHGGEGDNQQSVQCWGEAPPAEGQVLQSFREPRFAPHTSAPVCSHLPSEEQRGLPQTPKCPSPDQRQGHVTLPWPRRPSNPPPLMDLLDFVSPGDG